MFSLMVQLEVRPESREEFLAGMTANAEASVRDEPGCLRFDVCSVEGDENRFVLYELYADADAFAAHKVAPHFAEWRRGRRPGGGPPGQHRRTLLATNSAEVPA